MHESWGQNRSMFVVYGIDGDRVEVDTYLRRSLHVGALQTSELELNAQTDPSPRYQAIPNQTDLGSPPCRHITHLEDISHNVLL